MKTPFKRKGCGPQKLGSPIKLAPILGMVAKKVIVDKIAEKASPAKFKGANSSNSSCWKGYKKQGTKPSPTKPGVTVNNCVKK
tara:strand:- start:13 stop:261 length:249 start_codon:yes stop_codon:yes gene_type:complete